MKYCVYGDDIVLRIQKGEEILACIRELCTRERITLGSVSGIGAVGEVELGVFNRERFAYETRTLTGDLEIASCTGNISTMDGAVYLHLHMVVGNPVEGVCCGGHLSRGVVSLTGEFLLHRIHGEVGRAYSPEVGLNLFRFPDEAPARA